MHTSQGSSSRPVVRGGHSGHSGFSHQPASRRGCFECGDMGHFVRDYARTRRGDLHQGSQASTSRAAQPPTWSGAQNGRGGSHSGGGGSPSGRGGGRGVHNLMEVVLTVMLFQVGQRLKPQMLLSQVLSRFVIDQLLYYLIQALLILMCPHILLLVWIYCVSLLICRYVFLLLSGIL